MRRRLLQGSLAEPEDIHLGVRLDILEDEDEAMGGPGGPAMLFAQMPAALAAAAAVHGMAHGGQQLPPGFAALHPQHLNALLNQQHPAQQLQLHNLGNAGGQQAGAAGGLPQALAAAVGANGGGGAGPGGGLALHLPPAFALLLNHMAHLHLGGGGGGGGNGPAAAGGGGGGGGGGAAAPAVAAQHNQNHNHHGNHHNQHGRGAAAPLAVRAVQLQLGAMSPHMCYLNLALVPMVTQPDLPPPVLGANGEVLPPQQPPFDTRVAPVLLDLRGGGYTQLKSLAITGFVDHDCK